MEYRKDIQILRGVAVLLVVLFHLNLAGFSSGFLGVDVFFVISGYLMAVLYDENNKKEFFRRRALRLLPAYFMTVLLTVLVSIFIIKPNEYNQVVTQALYAGGFASNIGFWMQNSYFAKTEFNPMLHLWSLGVEIQFYILVPLVFYFLRIGKPVYTAITLMSLLLCFYVVGISPKTSFFMLPLRLWEFLVGYGVARYIGSRIIVGNNHRWLGTLSLLVIFAIPVYRVEETLSYISGHPGLVALAIAVATGLVLATGISSRLERSIAGNVLEYIGKYSYSIYLVHFPVIVLFLYKPFLGTILDTETVFEKLVISFIIIILSYAMFHLVENRFRKKINLFTLLFFSPLVIILLAYAGTQLQKILYSKEEYRIFSVYEDRDTYRCGKLFRIIHPRSLTCKLTDTENSRHRILLVGNSFADSLKLSFSNAAARKGADVYFLVPNTPLMEIGFINSEFLISEAVSNNIDSIVLHYNPGAITADTLKTLLLLAKQKQIHVAYIMHPPVWDRNVPEALWKNIEFGQALPELTLQNYRDGTQADLFSYMNRISDPGFRKYSVAEYFCKPQCRMTNDSGTPLYIDAGHLTITGSNMLIPLFEQVIEDSISWKQGQVHG